MFTITLSPQNKAISLIVISGLLLYFLLHKKDSQYSIIPAPQSANSTARNIYSPNSEKSNHSRCNGIFLDSDNKNNYYWEVCSTFNISGALTSGLSMPLVIPKNGDKSYFLPTNDSLSNHSMEMYRLFILNKESDFIDKNR